MCFTSSDRSDDPPPRPAQVPQQQQSVGMPPQPSKASMPQDFAPPTGPPPSQRLQKQAEAVDYTPPSGPPPPSHDLFAPPPGPPPSHRPAEEYDAPSGPPPSHRATGDYAPPSGPPPSHDYAPPTGPPPSSKNNPFYEDLAPPSGPPPSHRYDGRGSSDFAPPPGPPPSHDYAPPPGPPPPHGADTKKHDWETAVPDTSLLPPPPNFFSGFDRSPANNATEEEAEAGENWCRQFPMSHPLQMGPPELNASNSGNINMFAPPFFRGTLNLQSIGVWRGQSPSRGTDACLATYPPLYSVSAHSPLATGRGKTIYYEVHILQDSRDEVSLALGFSAPPYPPFRLPGWHRGSVGVHGDDGNKYINDRWGGKTFTHPFRRGETLGLGMDFNRAPEGGIRVEIFLTRDGIESGRWNLHEETDKDQDLPVTGLEGFHDLCAAIGVFDKVSFDIVFVPEKWRWQGWRSGRY
ncbi:putative spry domain-containing protein [Rosellinia necatrix]|uniref:Putative spry domain-containing protein n=1 Tax=Rosellinia necatrix TaxID=77044 RepID=A0A1S7ULT6_ROSNE|nr:putative spry domain-containing protein [Rosellinia necatrix]